MKICPICGKKYRMETSCPICHMPLVDEGQNRSGSDLNTQEQRTVSKSNYIKYNSARNNSLRKEISISQTTLIGGIIIVVCLVLVVVFLKSFSGRNNSNTTNNPNIIQSDNPSNGNDSDEGAVAASDATEDTELQEEEGMTLPYTDNTYMDTSSCLSEADFASVTSEDGSFKFCYPKYIFNSFSYDEEQKEYYFSYTEDGEELCSLKIYKTSHFNEDMISAAKSLRYKFEDYYSEANYYWPAEDLSKLTSDSDSNYAEPRKDGISRYVMSGWTTSDRSEVLYCLGANDGYNDYIMEFTYPDYNVDDDMEQFDYITECLYRDCSFSGTSYAVRSYDTYMEEGFKEGHH